MPLIELMRKLDAGSPAASLTLDFARRAKSRLRATLDDGRGVSVILPRGSWLRPGDLLGDDDGLVVEVCAAAEEVSIASTADPLLLARAAYHLGNRHVALQVRAGELLYLHDHVLDDMVRQLGLSVISAETPFEPEPGAYGDHAHSHGGHHGHHH